MPEAHSADTTLFLTASAASASLDTPHAVAYFSGTVAIADTNNDPVRLITSGGIDTLVGWTHGFDSQFPSYGAAYPRANSFQAGAGGGLEFSLRGSLFLRLPQVEYLYTSFPNNSTGWRNNLRIGAGISIRFATPRKK